MKYEISELAAADIENIYVYTSLQFGIKQAEAYHNSLMKHFELLTSTPLLGKDLSSILSGCRRTSHQSHSIYCKPLTDKILIIRVLHSKQDPMTHL